MPKSARKLVGYVGGREWSAVPGLVAGAVRADLETRPAAEEKLDVRQAMPRVKKRFDRGIDTTEGRVACGFGKCLARASSAQPGSLVRPPVLPVTGGKPLKLIGVPD